MDGKKREDKGRFPCEPSKIMKDAKLKTQEKFGIVSGWDYGIKPLVVSALTFYSLTLIDLTEKAVAEEIFKIWMMNFVSAGLCPICASPAIDTVFDSMACKTIWQENLKKYGVGVG